MIQTTARPDRHPSRARRRGVTSVMAMLYLVLFSVLALGFYASVVLAVQIAGNEQRASHARLAAESGLTYLQYELSKVYIPPELEGDEVFDELELELIALLDGSKNLGGKAIARDGAVITIPTIALDNDGSTATATLTWDGSNVRLEVNGAYDGAAATGSSRSVAMTFERRSRDSSVFDDAIASTGVIQIRKSIATNILGTPDDVASIFSASSSGTSIQTGNGMLDGSIAVAVDKSQVSLGSGQVGGATGSTNSTVIMDQYVSVKETPEFPYVNTNVFKNALPLNLYLPLKTYYKNTFIPGGLGTITIDGNTTIEGIMFVGAGTSLTLAGNTTINGIIVMESGPSATLSVTGNTNHGPLPASADYDALRALSDGMAIVGPTATFNATGNFTANITGSAVVGAFVTGGSSSLNFTDGSVVTLTATATKIEGQNLTFSNGTGTVRPSPALSYSGRFVALPSTYEEVH